MTTNLSVAVVIILTITRETFNSNAFKIIQTSSLDRKNQENCTENAGLLHKTHFKHNDKTFNLQEEDVEMKDIVQRQYLALPYPPFTEAQISEEARYYQNPENTTPSLFSYLIQLEYINHYLFRGKHNFM